MLKQELTKNSWKLYIERNEAVTDNGFEPDKIADFSGKTCYDAELPSCLEKILFENNAIDDPCYSDNVFALRKYESYHQWYFTVFDADSDKCDITFDGVDTIADIIVNGKRVGHCDNMFVSHTFTLSDLKKKGNELIVHIYPACIAARDAYIPAMSYAMAYEYPSLAIRKSASSFGWDILPRFVCGGITREVTLVKHKEEKFNELYLYTAKCNEETARLNLYYNFTAKNDDIRDYKIVAEGICGNSRFVVEKTPWFTQETTCIDVDQPKLWFPRGYGEQNLYAVNVKLFKNGKVIDERCFDLGIRTVELIRTSFAANGKFEFYVNGKKIFILGTNWVPTDALRKEERERTQKGLELATDLGCNCIRVWGGGVYERDSFYKYCDKNGILVWQDFMMGCAIYPETEAFEKQISREVAFVVKRLRQHASIVLWAGDNEGDICHKWNGIENRSPVDYSVTRKTVAKELCQHDVLRPYLPSSPYVDNAAAKADECELSENHLWGPRDYFKGDFYKHAPSEFASEIGYHGYPSPRSAKKFLKNPEKFFEDNGRPTAEYLAHGTSPSEHEKGNPFEYRTRLFCDQVKTLFKDVPVGLNNFAKASQISQAEALKYFIEKFRIQRNNKGGIIWWNLLDGWPQISDGIVDYYFDRKLAYGYVKRSQTPVCVMGDENNGKLGFYLVNDEDKENTVEFTVTDAYENKTILTGVATVRPYHSEQIAETDLEKDEKKFYFIEWACDGKKFSNHFHTGIIDISFEKYLQVLEKCGYNQFEGF